MAESDPIKGEDIIQKNVFKNTIKSTEKLVETMRDLEDVILDIIKNQKKINDKGVKKIGDSKELEAALKALKKLKEANANFNTIQKERLKLEEKLLHAKDVNILENEKIRLQLADQRKATKELAKEQLGQITVYQKQSKRLNELRKQYKDLVLEEGKTTKASRKLLKTIKDLDQELKDVDASAGQFQRNVGNYPETLSKATKGIVALAAAAGGAALSFEGVKTSLEENQEGSEDLRKVTSALDGVFSTVKNTVATAALELFTFGKEVVDGEKSITEIGGAFDKTSDKVSTFGKDVKAAVDAEIDATSKTIEFEKALRPLEIRLEKLNGEIGKQLILAGDSTRSFDQIQAAVIEGQRLQIESAQIQFRIANQELDIIRTRLEQRKAAGIAVGQLLDEEKDAEVKLQQARNTLLFEQLDNQKILRETARDRFEQELDFAIDAFDSQKTVNERRIMDETASVEARRALLEETTKLTDSSFQNQIKLVQDFTGEKIDLDNIALESDEAVIRQRLKNFTTDEITTTRILEIIRERKLAVQDIAEAERDLNDVEQAAIDTKKDLLAQEEALAKGTSKAIEELEEDREDNAIASLRRRIALAKEGSTQFLELNQELNDLLLKQTNDRLAKEKEEKDKALAEEKERTKETIANVVKVTSAIGTELGKRSAERLAGIDAEIAANEAAIVRQQELAEKGGEEQLAFEKKRQAELAIQKRDAEEKAQREQEIIQTLEAFWGAYNARLDQPNTTPPQALRQAVGDTFLAKGIAKGVVQFAADGNDDVQGAGTTTSDSIPFMLSKHEGVVKASANMENAGVVKSLNDGSFTDMYMPRYAFDEATERMYRNTTAPSPDISKQQHEEVKGLLNEIAKKPVQHMDIGKFGELIETIYEKGVTTKIIHKPKTRI